MRSRRRTFTALVSDFSLEAESDGLAQLQHCRMLYPDMVRFLETGNRDIDVAVRAVNEGAVHRYFLKPWDEHKLRDALDLMIRSRGSGASSPPTE